MNQPAPSPILLAQTILIIKILAAFLFNSPMTMYKNPSKAITQVSLITSKETKFKHSKVEQMMITLLIKIS